jgi:hypothetical protein
MTNIKATVANTKSAPCQFFGTYVGSVTQSGLDDCACNEGARSITYLPGNGAHPAGHAAHKLLVTLRGKF